MMIVGPNGAGKSTCYRKYLAAALQDSIKHHIDPDAIEREIRADLAGEQLTDVEFSKMARDEANLQRRTHLKNRVSFSFETVFSDPAGEKLQFISEAVSLGYTVALLAVGLDSREKSRDRVALRVQRGGHNVPLEKVFERYPRVIQNISAAVQIASVALVVDNSQDALGNDGSAYEPFILYANGICMEIGAEVPPWWKHPTSSLPPLGLTLSLTSLLSEFSFSDLAFEEPGDGPLLALPAPPKPDTLH